jgi:hypothetical protein
MSQAPATDPLSEGRVPERGQERRAGFDVEFLFFLVPVSLVFFTLGFEGMKLGPATIRLFEVTLVLMLPLSLWLGRRGWFREVLDTPGFVGLLVAIGLVVISTVFLKRFQVAEMRELKVVVMPLVLLIVVATRYMHGPDQVRRALTAIGGAILASTLLVYFSLGASVLGVRTLTNNILLEHVGITYIWLGVSGALATGVFFWLYFAQRALLGRRGFTLALALLGLAVVLLSGTRAVILATLGFPVVAFGLSLISMRTARVGAACVLVVAFLLCMFPGFFFEILDSTDYSAQAGPRGTERLLESDQYADDLSSRLFWWKIMIDGRGLKEFLLGMDYAAAIQRTPVVAHPHNIFVWARIIAGFPAALALFLGYLRVVDFSVKVFFSASESLRGMATLNLFLHFMIIPVLLTNSWLGGTHLAAAVALALTVYVYRVWTQPGEGASGVQPRRLPRIVWR